MDTGHERWEGRQRVVSIIIGKLCVSKNLAMRMFITALFVKANIWKSPKC